MSNVDGPLYLDLEISRALFNTTGQYFLKIIIQGSPEKQNEVKLYVDGSMAGAHTSQHITNPCHQSNPQIPLYLTGSMVTFYLPQGFIDQDILLIVEAYKLPVNSLEAEQKCGQAVFLVYPYRGFLFPAKITSEKRSDDKYALYKMEKQLSLITEEVDLNGLSMSVGMLWLKAVLRTKDEKGLPQYSQMKVDNYEDVPGPSSIAKSDSIHSTLDAVSRSITESPLKPLNSSVHPRHLCGSYIARYGFCEVAALVHAAIGLPSKSDGRPPQPYVIGKSKRDHKRDLQAQSVTHTCIQSTNSPTWDEVLLIEFPQEAAKQEEVFVCIADCPSKELLAEYRIPVSQLKPFCQYNLELVKPNENLNSSSRLYVSLILKHDKLIKPVGSSGNIFGMEMLLRGMECPISNQIGSLIAVSKIVPNWNEYKENKLTAHPCTASVTMTVITFPSPHPTSLSVAGASLASGSPQVTVCGEPLKQPQWNQMFFFPGDLETLFSNKAALVVEFYPAALALSGSGWLLSNPLGYSHQMLDQCLASALQQENAATGLRLDGLPVQGFLNTLSGRQGSVGIVLRLLTEERPEITLSPSQFSSLPTFNEAPEIPNIGEQFTAQLATSEKNPYGLPTFDAVHRLLPSSNQNPKAGLSAGPLMSHSIQQPFKMNPNDNLTAAPLELRNTVDLRTLALLDYQMKEVDRYRTAMRKLAGDLLHLKQENSRLEEANSRHRRDLNQHDEISRIMVGSNDLDNVTHSELIQKFALLKKKLSDESTKRQELQKRTQKLQNELIKKNEKEKELMKLQTAHESQQALLQKVQGKLQKYKTIQDTCKKQEKVIVELEKLLANGTQDTNFSDDRGTNTRYIEENARLRVELEQCKDILKANKPQQQTFRTSSLELNTKTTKLSNSEKLELYQKIERSEGRILVLEKQLVESARKWAKEKTKIQAKLNEMRMEQQTGFPGLCDVNLNNSSSNVLFAGSRRSSPKLDPLARKRP